MPLSPRVKLATRLYATGAVKSKGEAAEAAGLDKGYFYVKSSNKNGSQEVHDLVARIDAALEDRAVNMSKVLELLGRRAVRNIADVMENGTSEGLRLKAAQDLADRSPETQKTQRHQVESFSLTGQDAKELAAILVESGAAREKYAHVAEGDFIRVDTSAKSAEDVPVPLLKTRSIDEEETE